MNEENRKLTTSEKRHAEEEKELQRFLVLYCDENVGLEVTGSDFCWAYTRARQANLFNAFITDPRMYAMLQMAGFEKAVVFPKGIQKRVVFKGLDVKWEKLANALGVPVTMLKFNREAAPFDLQKKYARKLKVVPPAAPKPQPVLVSKPPAPTEDPAGDVPVEPSRKPAPVAATHVKINGVLYERNLIATIRPIKPFKKTGAQSYSTHIVTFNNPELRHQWIDEEQAQVVEHFLTH
jgi:hypothetical protein